MRRIGLLLRGELVLIVEEGCSQVATRTKDVHSGGELNRGREELRLRYVRF